MSNKQRLQTNNTNLQSLIDKANALPDAGSGGAGVETIQLTINSSNFTGNVVYTDANYYVVEDSISAGSKTITCIKNSLVMFSGWGFYTQEDYTPVVFIDYMGDYNENGLYGYVFSNNDTINVYNMEYGPW